MKNQVLKKQNQDRLNDACKKIAELLVLQQKNILEITSLESSIKNSFEELI